MLKQLIALAIGTTVLFTGCDQNSKEADAYDIEMALDKGDYTKVLSSLGDCSQFTGAAQEDCYLNVGAAYFGLANFDLISIAQEISQIDDSLSADEQSTEFNKIVFNKLDDPNLQKGLESYKVIVDGNESVCNNKEYDNLTLSQQSACIAINPLLLSELLDEPDQEDSEKSENSVSLAQIIEFKDVLKDAVPELKAEDMVTIIDGGSNLGTDVDANQNDQLDSLEATDYTFKVFATNQAWTGDSSVGSDFNRTVSYTNDALKDKNITLAKITVTGSNNSNSYFRLVEYGTDFNTTLTTIPDQVCGPDNVVLPANSLDDITPLSGNIILPCVKLKDNGEATTLNDSVVNVLNNDDLIKSIALSTESEDDSKTDDEKIESFKEDLCGIDDTNPDGLCIREDGKLIITQDALIDYMSEDK